MPTPQKLVSPEAAASISTRAAVNKICQSTGKLLVGFDAELAAKARAQQEKARAFRKNLHNSVQSMMTEIHGERAASISRVRAQMAKLQREREDATNSLRAHLREYVANLHAEMRARLREIAGELRENARTEQQHLEELATRRRRATRSLRVKLNDYTENLHSNVHSLREHFRMELGLPEPARHEIEPRQARARKTPAEEAERRRKPEPVPAEAVSHKPEKLAKAKRTAKVSRSAPSRQRAAH
jgi:hypothetical protein